MMHCDFQNEDGFDSFIVVLSRCFALLFIYLQYQKFRRYSSTITLCKLNKRICCWNK